MVCETKKKSGFTLIELVMGMLIAGVVLLAAATFSFAMRQGQETTDLMLDGPAAVRGASIRITDLVHRAHALQQNDSIVTVQSEAGTSTLAVSGTTLNLDGKPLLKKCSGLSMEIRDGRLLIVRFKMQAETGWRDYEICAAVRCRSGG
ncbi:MAG TPA: type II secretion system protein [Anaerohalosphaeraceae bacterium]|nr:type II secretion system protein [Anaerohalosphaeraceae bacterium]HOL89414.1 type II secretion system protein [Anaerohalosphaeraceae bacterium]HPP55610.1 type II secretion system protein [Anaerohalosphaeraceae bacterium]